LCSNPLLKGSALLFNFFSPDKEFSNMFGPDKMGDIAGETFDVVNLRYISNQYRKSKTKVTTLASRVTKDTENTVNQSKLEVITCS